MAINVFNQNLLSFLNNSPSPFHCVASMVGLLKEAGFAELNGQFLEPYSRYYLVRNQSSIIAFTTGENPIEQGFRMVGAHTDSPCLKVKPNPIMREHNYLQLAVEVYGGALLNPWFDRDLSLAGRVTGTDVDGNLQSWLVDFKRAIATIPSLAIHLDKTANKDREVNAQLHLPPVLSLTNQEIDADYLSLLLKQQLLRDIPSATVERVLSYELCFYDTHPAQIIGLDNNLLASARLDNQLSCFVGLQALLATDKNIPALLICTDHEEVGSKSAVGADGPMLAALLERICPNSVERNAMIDRSLMISADNAHGIHPNYPEKHDHNHAPKMNEGPVIKMNANQRYASNSETAAVFKMLAEKAGVPVQNFVVRSDMGCGSTIGPITAAGVGVKTIDVGVPTLGMHSIRELAGTEDAYALYAILSEFYQMATPPVAA